VARGGCFNIDADFDYAELQELLPSRFVRDYNSTVSGAHFESSALTFAYLAAVHDAQMQDAGYDPTSFYDTAVDPDALLKVTGVTHALGAENGHTERIFDTDRGRCLEEPNLAKQPVEESCIVNTGTSGFVRSITDNAYALASPTAAYFDDRVSWSDVLAYLDAIAPVYPEASTSGVRNQVRSSFEAQSDADGLVAFAHGFGSVLDTLILALPAPENIQSAVFTSGAVGADDDQGEDDDDQGEDDDDQ
jgi:hypothetical protein